MENCTRNSAVSYVKNVEVTEIATENVLFRGNSFASKMFNTYCKLISLEYLWKTLGYIMYELWLMARRRGKILQSHNEFHDVNKDLKSYILEL